MKLRNNNLAKLKQDDFDVLVVGAGINGAVSAAALAAKGARVALIDQGDFASMTSQESSNLAWGGIKYLQTLDFLLVRNLCVSRNHLIKSYPSTVREIRFFATLAKGFKFPPWFIWCGTWFYWFMGNCFTKTPRYLTRSTISREEPAVNLDSAAGGFEYSDAFLLDNDARFVFGFVRSAMNRGCIAANYVKSVGSKRDSSGNWVTRVEDQINGETFEIRSRLMINAGGPLVDDLNETNQIKAAHRHVLSKGIHLIVPQITPSRRVLTFFAEDGRLFFVIPMGTRTCIGTTDTRVDHPTKEVTEEDRDFVLNNINRCLKLERPLSRDDVIAERCGVRPLVLNRQKSDAGGDFLNLSRKHVTEVDRENGHISIFGGKLTDCINVGDEIAGFVQELGVSLPHKNYRWYGEPEDSIYQEYLHQANLMDLDGYTAPESSEKLTSRLWRRYGAFAVGLLERIREDPAQAEVLIKGTEYLRCEIKLAARREMITRLEDFLRRRSKIALIEKTEVIRESAGLVEACEILFGDQAQEKIDEYFESVAQAKHAESG